MGADSLGWFWFKPKENNKFKEQRWIYIYSASFSDGDWSFGGCSFTTSLAMAAHQEREVLKRLVMGKYKGSGHLQRIKVHIKWCVPNVSGW